MESVLDNAEPLHIQKLVCLKLS